MVENASMDDVIAALSKTMPERKLSIQVRGATPMHDSFDVKDVRVGDVLQHVASKAGCDLFVFSRGLLLCPASQLTDEERADMKIGYGGRWKRNAANAIVRSSGNGRTVSRSMVTTIGEDSGWSAQNAAQPLFAYAIAADVHGGPFTGAIPGVIKLKAGDLSLDSQKILQQLINWSQEENLQLHPQAVAPQVLPNLSVHLSLDNPTGIRIEVGPDASQPAAWSASFGFARP